MSEQSRPSNKSGSVYYDLLLEGQFCDAVIKVENLEFQIHKIILCNCTPYFRALFTHCNKSSWNVFNIPGLAPEKMQQIIEFAYTGFVSVTEDNVQELLLAADYLNIMGIVKSCCDFLCEQLCPENCVGIWQFTNGYFFPELRQEAFHYIILYFEEVVSQEEFLQLTVQELADILNRDDLNVQKENTVYEAVIRWISHLPQEREQHLTTLMSKVRLALMSFDYISSNVLSSELLNNPECVTMVADASVAISQMRSRRHSASGFFNSIARPRLPNAILLAIGGWSNNGPTNGMETYDYRTEHWINLTNNLEHPRAYHGAVFLNGHVYCIGGFNGVDYFSTMSRFEPTTHTWQEVAPMHYRRCYVSVTALNGYIYAMGGHDGRLRLNTAERYKPESNQWSLIASMHVPRSDAGCATLNNKIYICGGFNGDDCLQTAEVYSPTTDQWQMITPMTSPRTGIGVATYMDRIFAVGGYDGTSRLRSAEAYNPLTNSWNPVASMMNPRSNFGTEIIDNRLFVVGGFTGHTITSNVEYYDATSNEWFEACNMEISRSAVSCCVLSGLSNMIDYTVPRDALPLLDL